MSLFHRAATIVHESEDAKWEREHPYGEEGSVEYWIEALKRAAQLGETRAQAEIDRLLALPAGSPPMTTMDFPMWFMTLWNHQLASYNRHDHRLAMPY